MLFKYGWTQEKSSKINDRCKICLDELAGQYVLTTGCNHSFHKDCILRDIAEYDRSACPDCRKTYTYDDKYLDEIIDNFSVTVINKFNFHSYCHLCDKSMYKNTVFKLQCDDIFHKHCFLKHLSQGEEICPSCEFAL